MVVLLVLEVDQVVEGVELIVIKDAQAETAVVPRADTGVSLPSATPAEDFAFAFGLLGLFFGAGDCLR